MIAIGDTFSTFRASMTRSRASSSPSRMLKSINNSGLVRLSMLNLDWKGGKNETINKNICRYIFCPMLYFSKSTEQDLFFSSLRFLLNIVHPTIREVTAKLNLILRQRKEMQRKTFWRDFYFVVLHTSSAVVPLCGALSGVGRSCRPSSGLISVMRNSNHG